MDWREQAKTGNIPLPAPITCGRLERLILTENPISNGKRKVTNENVSGNQAEFKNWMCLICGWIYDEATGAPDEGIAPGTRWEDVPINWTCPECGARKSDFEMVEF